MTNNQKAYALAAQNNIDMDEAYRYSSMYGVSLYDAVVELIEERDERKEDEADDD